MTSSANVMRAEEDAAVAEVSAVEYASDTWPDGKPKRFRGREAWKNYIDFDSPFKGQTDELNRQRHYFFHVDVRGRLWRKELHRLDGHDGEIRDPRTLDFFFSHMQPNESGLHEQLFPFISHRGHEHYFTSCDAAPVVFNELQAGELRLLCPGGELATSLTTRFEPSELRLGKDGKLYHPLVTKGIDHVGAQPHAVWMIALIESLTAQRLLEHCEECEGIAGEASIVLKWLGDAYVLKQWED